MDNLNEVGSMEMFFVNCHIRFVEISQRAISWVMILAEMAFDAVHFLYTSSCSGFLSLIFLGTASLFITFWCFLIVAIAVVGITRLITVTAIFIFLTVYIGARVAIAVFGITYTVFLVMQGSFLVTTIFISAGVWALEAGFDSYTLGLWAPASICCVTMTQAGRLGLLLGMGCNLALVTRQLLRLFLKLEPNRAHRPQEQAVGSQHQHASSLVADPSAECDRLSKCTDHYSAFGLPLYTHVDVAFLEQQFRRKAILVHPQINPSNEKAPEAFQKLHDAFEVLNDPFKQKAYDHELRKVQLLRFLDNLINSKIGRTGLASMLERFKDEFNDKDELYREIPCQCNETHLWLRTNKSVSHARWCQECKEFHSTQDGEGWVEQITRPIFFGWREKKTTIAYLCVQGQVFDITSWYECQNVNIKANTHRATFTLYFETTQWRRGSGRRLGPTRVVVQMCVNETSPEVHSGNTVEERSSGGANGSASSTSWNNAAEERSGGEASCSTSNGSTRKYNSKRKKGKRRFKVGS